MFDRLKAEFKDTVTRYNKLQKDVAQKVKSSVVLSRYVHEQPCPTFQHIRSLKHEIKLGIVITDRKGR